MALPFFTLLRPRSLEEALEMLGRDPLNTKVLAGGTDLLPSMKQGIFTPVYVLDLSGVSTLRGIKTDADGTVVVGSLTTLSEIAQSASIREKYQVLAEAAGTVASPVLRNMGTIGGNICLDTRCKWYNQSYLWRQSCGFCIKKDGDVCHVAPGGTQCWAAFSADTPPALLVLGAEIEIASCDGTRRVRLSEFYTGNGEAPLALKRSELVARIHIPGETSGMAGTYKKFRVRGSIDYPLAGVAVAASYKKGVVTHGRIALTAVNTAPMLVQNAERLLEGVDPTDTKTLAAIVAAVNATAKPLTTSALTPEYRREIVKVFARRGVQELIQLTA